MPIVRTIIRIGVNVAGFFAIYVSRDTMYIPGMLFGAGMMMIYLVTAE